MVSDQNLVLGTLYLYKGWTLKSRDDNHPLRLWVHPTTHGVVQSVIYPGDIVIPVNEKVQNSAGEIWQLLTSRGIGWHIRNAFLHDRPLFDEL